MLGSTDPYKILLQAMMDVGGVLFPYPHIGYNTFEDPIEAFLSMLE